MPKLKWYTGQKVMRITEFRYNLPYVTHSNDHEPRTALDIYEAKEGV